MLYLTFDGLYIYEVLRPKAFNFNLIRVGSSLVSSSARYMAHRALDDTSSRAWPLTASSARCMAHRALDSSSKRNSFCVHRALDEVKASDHPSNYSRTLVIDRFAPNLAKLAQNLSKQHKIPVMHGIIGKSKTNEKNT